MPDEPVRPQPSTIVWRHWYRVGCAGPFRTCSSTLRQNDWVTFLAPGVVCKAAVAYGLAWQPDPAWTLPTLPDSWDQPG